MGPTFLIDAEQENSRSAELQQLIRNRGFTCHAVKFFPETARPGDIVGAEHIPIDSSVVFFGGPALMKHIQCTRRWQPGGWCTFENLRCEVYFCYFGKHLLNASYALLPACEALRQSSCLFDQWAKHGDVFVRPAQSRKLFNGTCVDRNEFHSILARKIDPRCLVVISSPKPVGREWRLFVAHDRVITGSQYANQGEPRRSRDLPSQVVEYAEEILKEVDWRPDPLFTMDLCESDGRLFLVELNGFSCSNHYDSDLDAIVEAVSAEVN